MDIQDINTIKGAVFNGSLGQLDEMEPVSRGNEVRDVFNIFMTNFY